jgi:hypothetical protein
MLTTTQKQRNNLKKWIDALRSGEYKQAVGALAQQIPEGIGFCCLGVACVIRGEAPESLLNVTNLRHSTIAEFGLYMDHRHKRDDANMLATLNDNGSLISIDHTRFNEYGTKESFLEIANDLEFYLEFLNVVAEDEAFGFVEEKA